MVITALVMVMIAPPVLLRRPLMAGLVVLILTIVWHVIGAILRQEKMHKQHAEVTYDSVLVKRILTYLENRGNLDYSHMNVFTVAMENYIFLERRQPHLSKNV